MNIQPGKPHCYRKLSAAVRPRERLTVSDWADRHRLLSTKQSSMPGRWRTAINPLLAEIMDCLSANSPVQEIVVMKSNQVGVTEAMVNALGYIMAHAPGPAMVLMPTLADRDTWKVQKLNPLLQETPAVRDLLGGLRSRDAANRQDMIDFPGGMLYLSGGNSPNSYAQKTVRWIMLDDLDRFPVEVGNEGDPVSLARGRTKAYPHKRKIMLVSTPTIMGGSLIEREYNDSDQRRYFVACPHCAQMQPLAWPGLRYETINNPPESAWYECESCAGKIDEGHKPRMLAGGRWIAERPGVARRGYHVNALYAPIGLGPSWLDLAREWVGLHRSRDGKARKADPALLKAFINLHLGEPWEDRTAAIKPHHLQARAEETPRGSIPPGVLALTVGIDTQDTWLDITLLGWRQWQDDGSPGWRVIDWQQIQGDTSRPEPWDELERYLNAERINAYGNPSPIHAAAIDNRGHRGEQVKAFCKRTSLRIPMFRVQGSNRRQAEIIATSVREPERDQRGRSRRGSFGLWNVGTETAKDLIYASLVSDADQEPQERRLRFPAELPDEYWFGLLSEVYNPETRRYEQRRGADYKRNEPLDGLVYAIAIGHHREVKIGMRRARIYRENGASQLMMIPDPSWWRRQALVLEAERKPEPAAEPPPPPEKQAFIRPKQEKQSWIRGRR